MGGLHACALAGDGEVYCWGSNDMFQLGNATTTAQPPVKVEGLPGRAVAVYAGTRTSCAVLEDRRLACWGWHMGAGTDSADWPPAILVEQPVAKAGNLNGYAHFALTEAGHALSWGQYYYLLRRDIIPLYEPRRCCDTF